MGYLAFKDALVADDGGVRCCQNELLGRNRCVDILQMLENPMNNSQMIPNKLPYPQIFRDFLVGAIQSLMPSGLGLDWKVIYKWHCMVGDLILQNEHHIGLINLDCVSVSHRQSSEMMWPERTIECSHVLGVHMQRALVITCKQVHHTVDRCKDNGTAGRTKGVRHTCPEPSKGRGEARYFTPKGTQGKGGVGRQSKAEGLSAEDSLGSDQSAR